MIICAIPSGWHTFCPEVRELKKTERRNPVWALIFLAYAALMLYLLFFRNRTGTEGLPYWDQVKNNYNLIPWFTVKNYWDVLTRPEHYTAKWGAEAYAFQAKAALINVLGNIAMFVPFGAFLPAMWGKLRKFYKSVLAGLLSIIFVEICQLLTLRGRCDVDDVLLNMIGIVAGYGIWKMIKPGMRKKKSK